MTLHRMKYRAPLWIGALVLGACTVSDTKSADTMASASAAPATVQPATPTPATSPVQPATPASDTASTSTASSASSSPLRVEVDLKARKLYLYENGQRVETHRVAIGSEKWPTQTGEWTIKQVIFNPEWIPPDETWAEERQPKKSGAPDNPLGRAQLVYDPPRTIHGTNQPSSIGTNVSHGSIRMNNAEIVALAKRIMTASGAPKDDAWYAKAATQRTEKQVVDLPHPVPIKVY
ncbi:MAG TPA: L,D-transpeptidase [Gemmatimonadaceae bacterium]|nr:L,D-transpeptidase [Gemmatimonadaceae bacterium]